MHFFNFFFLCVCALDSLFWVAFLILFLTDNLSKHIVQDEIRLSRGQRPGNRGEITQTDILSGEE